LSFDISVGAAAWLVVVTRAAIGQGIRGRPQYVVALIVAATTCLAVLERRGSLAGLPFVTPVAIVAWPLFLGAAAFVGMLWRGGSPQPWEDFPQPNGRAILLVGAVIVVSTSL